MDDHFALLEERRLALQAQLDAQKTASERNRLGQFATPSALAQDMLRYSATLLPPGQSVRFLDPALGTGSFYSALRRIYPRDRVAEAVGFEVDPHYAHPAQSLWEQTGLTLQLGDFTAQVADPRFNLLICNPPYVRHHHLTSGDKGRLQVHTQQRSGMRLSGLAGLYGHFLGLSHGWMAPGAVAGWLVPSEFMDVNYGGPIKQYLLHRVTLLRIHRFDPNDVQFDDALVSSAVVWLRHAPPAADHVVEFSFGGSLSAPALVRAVPTQALAAEPKWTRFPVAAVRLRADGPRLSDFFRIKRGVATGDNRFFILPEEEIATRGLPWQAFRPILPSPRYLADDEVEADPAGNPLVGRRLFLLDCNLEEREIEQRFPELWRYLQEGRARGLHERYLCRHRPLWYAQEKRPPAPIVCTYLGRSDSRRGRPFRFILNHSQATVANVYLAMHPTTVLAAATEQEPRLWHQVWTLLNQITPEDLLGEGRVYGGGLHKLEPKELANVPAAAIAEILAGRLAVGKQPELLWV